MAVPEALEVAESVPHAPGLQWERDQETPLLWESFATVAVKICVCANWSVTDAGEAATEVAACGGGVVVVGGSPVGVGEWALEFEGTEAQLLARNAASRQSTVIATGARATAGTPASEFKGKFSEVFPEQNSVLEAVPIVRFGTGGAIWRSTERAQGLSCSRFSAKKGEPVASGCGDPRYDSRGMRTFFASHSPLCG